MLVKSVSCNLSHLISDFNSHIEKGEHSHHHSVEANHSQEGSDDHTKSSSKKDGNCCNDEAANFFKSISSQDHSNYKFKSQEFHQINILTLQSFVTCQKLDFVIYNYSLPPPKIPDIRVHIQSFQI